LVELGFLSHQDEGVYFAEPVSYLPVAMVLMESLIKNLNSYERVRD
jgi:hypothetical protein